MPRDLADVLHYFLPELEDDSDSEEVTGARIDAPVRRPGQDDRRVARVAGETADPQGTVGPGLRILGVPIGDRDVVRAALTWNLAVEMARLGNRAIVLAPVPETETPLWPEAGVGPLGTELVFCRARSLAELAATAEELAHKPATRHAQRAGTLFVRVPPGWLIGDAPETKSIPDWLLLSGSNREGLAEAHEWASAIRRGQPEASVGVTIHGVSTIEEARRAYEHLARRCATASSRALASYGLLVDDLHVYRAIAAQRPIGLAHPQAPATRALMDVARLLAEDGAERRDD